MFVVLSGSITIDTENGEFLLTQNDCFIVKEVTRHRAKTDGTAMLMTLISKSP
jgi:mannose-6-phosphate isomerase-like protein (cupin superfamily)